MSAKPIKVTVSDPVTGEVLGAQVIENDYVVICAGNRSYSVQAHLNGTHVVTIRRTEAHDG